VGRICAISATGNADCGSGIPAARNSPKKRSRRAGGRRIGMGQAHLRAAPWPGAGSFGGFATTRDQAVLKRLTADSVAVFERVAISQTPRRLVSAQGAIRLGARRRDHGRRRRSRRRLLGLPDAVISQGKTRAGEGYQTDQPNPPPHVLSFLVPPGAASVSRRRRPLVSAPRGASTTRRLRHDVSRGYNRAAIKVNAAVNAVRMAKSATMP